MRDRAEIDRLLGRLVGSYVSRCILDYAFTVCCVKDDGADWQVRIEGDFSVRDRDAVVHDIQLERKPESMGAAFAAVHGAVLSRLTIDEDRALVLEFDNGSRISVPPDERHEAWSVTGSGGIHLVCAPGGVVSIH